MGVMGWLLVIVGIIMLFVIWPIGLLFLALGVWMISSAGRADRQEQMQARMLAEMQMQREAIERERHGGQTPSQTPSQPPQQRDGKWRSHG
jgi:hypothetical protein